MKSKYVGHIVKCEDGFSAIILEDLGGPNLDTVKQIDNLDYDSAVIWIDDELSRLETGKGIWDGR